MLTMVVVVGCAVIATTGVEGGARSRNYFVESGGIVAHPGRGCVLFVKKGGRISLRSGSGGQTVFYESDADIGNDPQRRRGDSLYQVESLSLSVVSSPIEISRRLER